MRLSLIGQDHPYLRRMKRALQSAGHDVATDSGSPADHVVIDARSLADATFDLGAVSALVHHPHQAAIEKLQQVRRVIATNTPVAGRLADEYGIDRARIAVVLPGVDAAPRPPGNAQGCRLLSIGALVPRKGHDVLLRALARLFDLDWHLTIVGTAARDAAHAASLQELAATAGLAGRVQFTDTGADDAALERLWQSSDAFALATYWEGYGMAVADALRRGLPVAVTAGGEAAALVPPLAGVVCPPGDHDGLSKALRRVIFDRALRRQMHEASWAVGQTLPLWREQADKFLAALA